MKKNLAVFIATTFYSGFFPIAPGTVGAFVAIVAFYLLPPLSWWVLVVLSVLFFIPGVWAADVAEKTWGKDPGRVNWDEVVGMMISIVAVPHHWLVYLIAFFLFRVFDVIKPWPVNKLENIKGGMGIMIDDVMAGIYSNLALQLILLFIWRPGM